MKRILLLLLVLCLSFVVATAQNQPAQATQPSALSQVYHVHFAKAVPGKAAELGNYLKQQAKDAPMAGQYLVLRHQEGDDWDYAVIEHLGPKATVDANATPPPVSAMNAGAWHTDTFVAGPAWDEFAPAMAISGSGESDASPVYVLSVYRAVPGHRQELRGVLEQPPAGGTGNVLMQHLEGGPWQYLTIVRYNSWPDFAKSEADSVGQLSKPDSATNGWYRMREHAVFHRDTVADRIAPMQQQMKPAAGK